MSAYENTRWWLSVSCELSPLLRLSRACLVSLMIGFSEGKKSGKNGVFFCLARTAESNPSGSTSNLMFRTMGRPVEFTASRNLASDPEPQRSAQEVRRHNTILWQPLHQRELMGHELLYGRHR